MFYDCDKENTFSDASRRAPAKDKNETVYHHGPDISNLSDEMTLALMDWAERFLQDEIVR